MIEYIIKRNGTKEEFNADKIKSALKRAFISQGFPNNSLTDKKVDRLNSEIVNSFVLKKQEIAIEDLQDLVETVLMDNRYYEIAKSFILYRDNRKKIREFTDTKLSFIQNYKESSNTANATIDDNSNVSNKNIGILNAEIHKEDNIQISRRMIVDKLRTLYPDFNAKNYIRDLEHHIIYKHDESSFAGAIAPYCCSITMYPFLKNGIRGLGGLSAAPKNLDSFCGMYINLIFAASAQFAGAVATSEFLLYFDYFARKEWGDNYLKYLDAPLTTTVCKRQKTIKEQIHQYFQQVIYSINQPSAARGLQSAFINFSFFDKPFFDGMFGEFMFPDGTSPIWETFNWLQQDFLHWFNAERLRTILTFPVCSYALVYRDGKFEDKETADFVAKELSEGNSFFIYTSDTVDSLSSCCFSKDTKVLWKTSTGGVNRTSLEELHNTKGKTNLRIFHNGSWVKGKSIKLPNRKMFKVVTENNKEFIMTDNHINVTFDGEKTTDKLTINDYLMFNTSVLDKVPEDDEHLTYEQGFVIGAFLGDGSFGSEINGTIYDTNFSQNKDKVNECVININKCLEQLGIEGRAKLSAVYNNVYPVRVSSKELVAFIQKWTKWFRGTYAHNKRLNLDCLLQSVEFRKGILDGWYNTDGGNSNRCYTTSSTLAEDMETLITSLGMNSIINISDRTDEKVIIRDKEYAINYPLYCVRWYENSNHRTNKNAIHSWKKKNNSIFFKIKSIEEIEYTDDVYCIECNNTDEPYFTLPSGLITHNCRLKNMVQTKEFNFTNGNIGVQTGSKSVITLNLNRIIQDYYRKYCFCKEEGGGDKAVDYYKLKEYLIDILERVYKYHTAYNELLWDMYKADLLPVYKAGFINLNKQYLTIGLNGLNQAAEFLYIKCTDNDEYKKFCTFIFETIKEQNQKHKTAKTTFNTEFVPAESLAAKNYKYDKEDGYWIPDDTNLYASYIFKPNDKDISLLDKFRLHGRDYIGEYLDGGSAAHINLDTHPTFTQCQQLLDYAAKVGCQYWTINVPNSECEECGYITKHPLDKCPKCGSAKIALWDRVIGYLSKIKNWSKARQEEQETRVYSDVKI